MHRSIRSTLLLLPLLFTCGRTSHASTVLIANLTNGAEFPPTNPTTSTGQPRPASFGNATFILNDDMSAMTMTVTIFNIDFTGSQTTDPNDNLTIAHIHASPTASLTSTAPVVWGFIGSPFNDTTPNDALVTPFTNGSVGGTVVGKWDAPEGQGTTLTAQLNNILTGHAYINFHTTQFGGGETRGFLTVVPEPSTLMLLGSALLGLGVLRSRRRS